MESRNWHRRQTDEERENEHTCKYILRGKLTSHDDMKSEKMEASLWRGGKSKRDIRGRGNRTWKELMIEGRTDRETLDEHHSEPK